MIDRKVWVKFRAAFASNRNTRLKQRCLLILDGELGVVNARSKALHECMMLSNGEIEKLRSMSLNTFCCCIFILEINVLLVPLTEHCS